MSQAPRRELAMPLPVAVRRSDGSCRSEHLVNVSESGLCLHMQTPVSVGEALALAFRLPPDDAPIEAACKVVWTSHAGETHPVPRLFETGLFVVGMSDAHRARIGAFVRAQVDRS